MDVKMIKVARAEDTWTHILHGIVNGKSIVALSQTLLSDGNYTLSPADGDVGDVVMLVEDYEALPEVITMGAFDAPHIDFSHVEYVLNCREFEVAAALKLNAEQLLVALS